MRRTRPNRLPRVRLLVCTATIGALVAVAPALGQSRESSEQSEASRDQGLTANLAREVVTARRRLTTLSGQIDKAEAEVRKLRAQARRELVTSPEIERARLDIRDARHDYYAARDAVVSKFADNPEYAETQEQIRELEQQIAALRPAQDGEMAQQAAARMAGSSGTGIGDAPADSTASPTAAEPEAPSDASAQDQVFELANRKLRLADKVGSIEVEALRATPELQSAWERYNADAARLVRLEGQIEDQLSEHEGLAQAKDRLERLQHEYETLEAEAEGARAAYEEAVAQRARDEEYRQRNRRPADDDWYYWLYLNRRSR